MTAPTSRGGASLTVAVMLETDGPGGAELLVHQLCLELRHRGHRVVAVGPEHGEGWLSARLRGSGIERRRLLLRRALDGRALRELTRILRQADVDAVHSHEFTMGVYGCAATRWLHVPHVITMHGDQGVTAAWRRRAALRWAFRHSHAAVAVSESTRGAMEGRLGLPAGALQVVYNGIPVPAGGGDGVRRELGLRGGEALVLAVGSLRPNKGHAILIEALARLRPLRDLPRCVLAIAGQGPERAALESQAERLGVADRVRLLGQRDDIADVQAAADIFAMPSYAEGLPLALLEAMFAESAIIASRVGGIPEAVREGVEALLAPPGDAEAWSHALARLLSDTPLRDRLGAAAKHRADAEFRIERMVDRYEALYRRGRLDAPGGAGR